MERTRKLVGGAAIALAIITVAAYESSGERQETGTFTTNIDLQNKTISELAEDRNDQAASPFLNNLLENGRLWLSQNFNVWRFYQNLANPSSRYIVLSSGLRKEEVANVFLKELSWNAGERYKFITMDKKIDKKNLEGRYSPGTYLMPVKTTAGDAYKIVMKKFDEEVGAPYASSSANVINMELALKIASIIEREAAGTKDMRLISGIIWNRLFKNMNLEMDATLQYAKGSSKKGWWPKIAPEDKYIDSPYNTYQNSGLPPTPISNVSIAAIKAALNPKKTSCIFYLHDKHGLIHCAVTYKEHLANIKRYYGK